MNVAAFEAFMGVVVRRGCDFVSWSPIEVTLVIENVAPATRVSHLSLQTVWRYDCQMAIFSEVGCDPDAKAKLLSPLLGERRSTNFLPLCSTFVLCCDHAFKINW